jgi:hypothetical protein
LAAFDRALEISPEMEVAHAGRAAVLSALGKDLDAVEALRKAFVLGFRGLDTVRTLEGSLGEEARSNLRRLLSSWGLSAEYDGMQVSP